MAIDPRISLSRAPTVNVGQRFGQALQNVRALDLIGQQREQAPFQNRLLELEGQLAEAQQPAQVLAAERAASPLTQAQQTLTQEQQLGVQIAQSVKPMLDAGNTLGAIAELTRLNEQNPNLGLADDIQELQADPAQYKAQVDSILQLGGVTQRPVAQTASQRDFETFKNLERQAKQTPETEDDIAAEQFGRQAGFVRPTEAEKADIKVSEAERKEVAKSNAKRKQGFIDAGVEAADSVANIKRSIELLETVKTGGFDRAAFRARQIFGIEGADEGELSANLGRSVLAQLKPIFGAAFTAAEGERLERIEAGFGRSPETNKRLLNSALRIAERASRRGLAAAEDQGDAFTANEIKEALAFKFDEDATVQPGDEQPQPQEVQFQEGQTATNPQTGAKVIFRNGNWEPFNG